MFLLTSVALLQILTTPRACEMAPAARAEYTLASDRDYSRPRAEFAGNLLRVAKTYPQDAALQFAVLSSLLAALQPDERKQLAALYAGLPDRDLRELLTARMEASPRTLTVAEQALAANPKAVWALILRLQLAYPGFPSEIPGGSDMLVERLSQLCPDSPWRFLFLSQLANAEQRHVRVRELRQMLLQRLAAQRAEPADTALWQVVFEVGIVPLGRAALLEDLQAMRKAELHKKDQWFYMMMFAYRQLGDQGQSDGLRAEIAAQQPDSRLGCSMRRIGIEPALKLYRDCKRFPMARLGLDALAAPGVPENEFDEIVTWTASALDQSPDLNLMSPVGRYRLAEILLERKQRLGEAAAIVRREIDEARLRLDQQEPDPVFAIPGESMAMGRVRDGRVLLVKLAGAAEDRAGAIARLAEIREDLERWKPSPGKEIEDWNRRHGEYLSVAARIGAPVQPVAGAADHAAAASPGGATMFGNLDQPLGDFRAVDLGGRTWVRADLRGQLVFVYQWSPRMSTSLDLIFAELEKLHQLWSKKKNRIVLMIAVTSNGERVQAAFGAERYHFPVLLADMATAKHFFPMPGITGSRRFFRPDGRAEEPFGLLTAQTAAEIDAAGDALK